MRRRQFIAGVAGAAAWPLAARAQQTEQMRRIGVLMPLRESDLQGQGRFLAFSRELQRLGWIEGRNAHIDVRWSDGNPGDTRKYAAELVATMPDVLFTQGSAGTGPLLEATRTVPVVFAIAPDPVAAGYVDSLAKPGGNATGFINFEYGLAAKWIELLKEIAPWVSRAGILRDAALAVGAGQFGAIQSVAPALGIEISPINVRNAEEVERGITMFARIPNGGLIMTGSSLSVVHRDLIITLAARHRLPTIYFERFFITAGGLISYGPDFVDQFRQAAGYVDRVLRGEKPADLPVQPPSKYELVVNLKTAQSLKLIIPSSVLNRVDEVIE